MANKKQKISFIQITTFLLIIIYILWEKNVQQHFTTHPEDAGLDRIDLWIIIPILIIMIIISVWQFLKNRND